MKRYLKVLGVGTMLFMAACGDGEKKEVAKVEDKKIELTFVTYSGTGEEYMMDTNSLP